MSITVNTNMSSIIAQRSLYKSTNKMNTALERLSTGLRINSAKDDAAGSAISTKLEYKMSSYDVAKDNAQMGQSMLDTANGTLSNINSMLQRMRNLSEQASNGTYGEDERKAMQAEIDGLTEEIYRIKNTTEFNGKKILGEEEKPSITSIPTMSINDINLENLTQAEWDSNYKGQVFGISNAKELQKLATIVNDKKINTSDTTFAITSDIDLNELGFDKNGSNWVAIGNQDLGRKFKGIFDGNGYTISNLKIVEATKDQQGLFGFAEGSTIKNLNINNADITTTKNYAGILAGKMNDSTVENCNITTSKIFGKSVLGSFVGEANNIEIKNCVVEKSNVETGNNEHSIGGFIGNAFVSGSEIENIYCDVKLKNDGANHDVGVVIGGIRNNITITNSYFNQETNGSTVPAVGTSNTSTTADDYSKMFKTSTTNPFKNTNNISVNTNLQVGIHSDDTSVISVDTGFSLGDFKVSVLNEFSARNSLDKIDAMMNKVMAKMTEIGATQSRLENIMEYQEVQRISLTSANSHIKDADIAKEASDFIKNQILRQTTSAFLSTANQNPSIALQLI